MSNLNLGKIIEGNQQRDAVHIAVAPVVAAHQLIAGRHVALDERGQASEHTGADPIGVIDPFLTRGVEKGQKCWLFLYPNTITSLRHEWIHPAFSPEEKAVVDKVASEKWVEAYAQHHCPYDELNAYSSFMARVRDGEIFYHGSDLHGLYELDDAEELFGHLSVILGRPVNGESFEYSCSC